MIKGLARVVVLAAVLVHGLTPSAAAIPVVGEHHDCGHETVLPLGSGLPASGDEACCPNGAAHSCCALACSAATGAAMFPLGDTPAAKPAAAGSSEPMAPASSSQAPPTRPPIQ